MAMVANGPWQLSDITQAKVDYQGVPLPPFGNDPVTMSGPFTWTVFDNGEAAPVPPVPSSPDSLSPPRTVARTMGLFAILTEPTFGPAPCTPALQHPPPSPRPL